MENGKCGRLFLIIASTLTVCCNSLFISNVFADSSLIDNANQDEYKIELSPVSKRMSFKPGEQKKDSLLLTNAGTKAV